MVNIFSTKKKNQIQMSNPISQWGQSVIGSSYKPQMSVAPKMSVNTQAKPQMSFVQKPQMSVAPAKIQGSSATNPNYSGYRAPTSYQAPAPPVQKPTPSATSGYLADVNTAATRQKTFAEQQRDQQQGFIKQQYELANKQLGDQLPAAQQQFGQFKANTEASIADLLAGGERQKSQTSDYYGEAQRGAAQTLRETQGQNQRTFANLGTIDSRGEGSFGQATENTTSDFNRTTQQFLKAKADKLSEIDATVSAAERNARATITQEEAKMNELARNIQYALANNSLQEAQQLTQAYNETQQYIYDIEDSLSQTKYQFALEQEKLQNELAQTQSFTPEFMAGGPPTNQAEYEFFIKNQKDLQSAYGTDGSSGNQTKVASMINKLLQMDTKPITGFNRIVVPGTNASSTQAAWDGIKSLLTLAERGQLKGSGAVSDFETKILEKAAAAGLDPRMPDDQFRSRLSEILVELGGQPQASSNADPLGLGL